MAKFYGSIGYVTHEETAPGIYEEVTCERIYFGDVLKHNMRWEKGEGLNDDITINNDISIVSDPYAYQHLSEIKYVNYLGAKWKVTNITIERPRILLTIGGLYNGEQD